MKGNEAEKDSGMKAEEEEEAESSAGEDAGTLSGVGGADQYQSVGCIVHFANAVRLYQRKNQNCFRYSSPDHLVKDCLKDPTKTTQKDSLNTKEGMMKKGGWALQQPVFNQLASPDQAPRA